MTMSLPTFEQIERLHRDAASSPKVFELVFTHCCIVADIALQLIISKNLAVDRDLVRVGCLLHDIGVHDVLDENGDKKAGMSFLTHGVAGEQ